jgi:hypothetical protein
MIRAWAQKRAKSARERAEPPIMGQTALVIADPVHPQSSESVLPDRAARRPEFRHHDPQYRVSILAATATCSRDPQVTAAITGLWSRSEVD